MNWIQQHVLIELTRHPHRRYSELRPDGIEGNLFLYHLQGLIKSGLIEKTDRFYQLSVKGLQVVGTLSLKTGKQRRQPQILNAIVCQNETGQYLLSRWRRQPNTGLISFPHGMMHFGMGLLDMATLELAEKAGLTAELTYRGHIYIRGLRGDEVDRHMLVHFFEATNPKPIPDPPLRPDVSECFWADITTFARPEFVPGFYEVTELVRSAGPRPIAADITVEV